MSLQMQMFFFVSFFETARNKLSLYQERIYIISLNKKLIRLKFFFLKSWEFKLSSDELRTFVPFWENQLKIENNLSWNGHKIHVWTLKS